MRKVHTAEPRIDIAHLRNALEQAAIACYVQNERLGGAVGEAQQIFAAGVSLQGETAAVPGIVAANLDRAHAAGGSAAAVARNSRQASHTRMATLPARKSTLPNQASAVSAATRWISPMSLLMRETMSPRRVAAKKRGDRRCRCW